MINNDRIVPITAIDLISMYGLILNVGSVSPTKADPTTVDGQFTISTPGTKLCSQPVKKVNITAESATIYFVPAYDYEGFFVSGTAVETAGADVDPDGRTLYTATLSSGTVTIVKVGF